MFVGEYVDSKPNHGVRTLSKLEAKFFGEPYPLKAGWFERIQDIWIDSSMMAELRNRLETSASMSKKKRSTQKSLIALESGLSTH
ncbi:MAG: hypothetical protein KGL39_16795 [Patescibacteria group bacterium]|nr:hypothetical protein [Patescibacteria group bacterium]